MGNFNKSTWYINLKLNLMSYVTTHKNKEKTILLHNVEDPTKLNFDCKGVEYKLFSTEDPKKFSLEFQPNDDLEEKSISITNNGVRMMGTPIILKKRMPEFKVDHNNNLITLTNVSDPNLIELHSKRELDYDIYEDKNDEHTYHVQYKNPGDFKNVVKLSYDKKILNDDPIEIGSKTSYKPGQLIMSSQKVEKAPELKDQVAEQDSIESPQAQKKEEEFKLYDKTQVGKITHPEFGTLVHVHDPRDGPVSYLNRGELVYSGATTAAAA